MCHFLHYQHPPAKQSICHAWRTYIDTSSSHGKRSWRDCFIGISELSLISGISELSLSNKSPQTSLPKRTAFYSLTVSVDQESRHNVAGFSVQGPTSCRWGWGLMDRLRALIHAPFELSSLQLWACGSWLPEAASFHKQIMMWTGSSFKANRITHLCCFKIDFQALLKSAPGTSLVVQWLRLLLPRHRCKEQTFGLSGRRGWDDLSE